MRGIDDDAASVGTETRMGIDAPLAFVLGRLVEVAQFDFSAGPDVVQVGCLVTIVVWTRSYDR